MKTRHMNPAAMKGRDIYRYIVLTVVFISSYDIIGLLLLLLSWNYATFF